MEDCWQNSFLWGTLSVSTCHFSMNEHWLNKWTLADLHIVMCVWASSSIHLYIPFIGYVIFTSIAIFFLSLSVCPVSALSQTLIHSFSHSLSCVFLIVVPTTCSSHAYLTRFLTLVAHPPPVMSIKIRISLTMSLFKKCTLVHIINACRKSPTDLSELIWFILICLTQNICNLDILQYLLFFF